MTGSASRAPSGTAPAGSAPLVAAGRGASDRTGSRAAPPTAAQDGALTDLHGKVITVDPGHDGGNASHPAVINTSVFVVNGYKACDTTGTQTDGGYPEYAFTWDVAARLTVILQSAGATVVLTRHGSDGVGPCITERAAIGNRAHSDAAISIHADGGPASGYGFHVIEPGSVGPNHGIVARSGRLGLAIRDAFHETTGEPYATYVAHDGIDVRTDLGGLNLSTVPKVLIECANMRNAADADEVTSPAWRQQAARAIALGLAGYFAGQ